MRPPQFVNAVFCRMYNWSYCVRFVVLKTMTFGRVHFIRASLIIFIILSALYQPTFSGLYSQLRLAAGGGKY